MKYSIRIALIVLFPFLQAFAAKDCTRKHCKGDTSIILGIEYNKALLGKVIATNQLEDELSLAYFDSKGNLQYHIVDGAKSIAHHLLATEGCILVNGAPDVCVGNEVILKNKKIKGTVIGVSREIDLIAVRIDDPRTLNNTKAWQLMIGSAQNNVMIINNEQSRPELNNWHEGVTAYTF